MNAKLLILSLSVLFATGTQCNSISDYHPGETEESVSPSEGTFVTQKADTIPGQQGESAEFTVSEYFQSGSPLVDTRFSSPEVTVTQTGDGTWELSQPDTLTGTQIIDALLVNADSDTLEAELRYVIAASDGDNNGGDPSGDGDDGTGDDGGSGDGDNGDDGTGDDGGGEDGSSAAPQDLVVMPLGDSITNDSRSRVKLWNLLTGDGHELDYVGNQHQESSIPDPDHEGVGGIKIQGIADKAADLMESHSPGYVNLMVGTNDIAWYFDETPQEIADRWNELVQIIFDHCGDDTWVIAATIPPATSKDVGRSDMEIQDRAVMIAEYNKALRTHVENRRAAGDRIVLADMEKVMNLSDHVSGDGVHLSDEGYALMGRVYYEALTGILENN